MTARLSGRPLVLAVAGAAAALLIGFVSFQLSGRPSAPVKQDSEKPRAPLEAALSPSVDCSFNAFMHSSTAVSFYFDVALSKSEPPRFYERGFVAADGDRKSFEGGDRPAWTFSRGSENHPTITSPDGETHIVLYGLRIDHPQELLIEAGIRSNVFRNLGGQCRQINLAISGS